MTDNELSKKIKEVNLTAADIRAESGDRIGLNQARQWLRFEINGRGLSNAVRLMLELLIEKKRSQAKFGAQAPPSPLSSEDTWVTGLNQNRTDSLTMESSGTTPVASKKPDKILWDLGSEDAKEVVPLHIGESKLRARIEETPKKRDLLPGRFATYGSLVVFNFAGHFYSSSDISCREFYFLYEGVPVVAILQSDNPRGKVIFTR